MAWSGNFHDRITAKVGATYNGIAVSGTNAEAWVLDGCQNIVERALAKYGPEEIRHFVAKTAITTHSGENVDEQGKIHHVIRDGVRAAPGEWSLINKYSDSNSIYLATKDNPIWYIDNALLHVLPITTAGEPGHYYKIPTYEITKYNSDTSSIDDFPIRYYYFAMIYACIKVIQERMTVTTAPTAITIPPSPIAPDLSTSSVTLTGLAPVYIGPASLNQSTFGAFSGVLSNLSIDAVVPSSPTMQTVAYNGPDAANVGVAPVINVIDYVSPSSTTTFTSRLTPFTALSSFSISATPPDVIGLSGLVSSDIDSVALANINDNVPVYVPQSIGINGILNLGDLKGLHVNDLSISAAPPAVPSMETVTYNAVSVEGMDAMGELSVSDIVATTSIVPTVIDGTDMDANQPSFNAASVPVPPSVLTELAKMKAFINTDEDPELSRAKGEEIQAILSSVGGMTQQFQGEIANEKHKYDKENVIYQQKIAEATANFQARNQIEQANMQKDIQSAQQNLNKTIDLVKQNSSNELARKQLDAQQKHQALMQDAVQSVQTVTANNTAKIQKYGQELSLYNAQVDNQVKEYQQNLSKAVQIWQGTNSTVMQEHGARVQDELNRYNAEAKKYDGHLQAVLAKFQGDLQSAMKNSEFTMQAEIQGYTFQLERWQKEIDLYQHEVNTEVQEFTQRVQVELPSWQAEQANALQQYQYEAQDNMKEADIVNQAALQQGQLDLQVATRDKDRGAERELQNAINSMQSIVNENQSKMGLYQGELEAYKSEVQSITQEYTQNLQKAIQTWTTEQANELQRYQSELQDSTGRFNSDNTEYQAILQKDVQDAQLSDAAEGKKISKYQTEVQEYQAEVGSQIQKYQAEVQAQGMEYQWLQDQYAQFSKEYEMAFAVPQIQQ